MIANKGVMRHGTPGIRQSLFFMLMALVITMTSLFLLLTELTVSRQVGRTYLAEIHRTRIRCKRWNSSGKPAAELNCALVPATQS